MLKPNLRVLLILLFIPMWCFAQQIQVKSSAPEQYTVKQGDTLWDISNLFLEKPWLWPELWRTNTQIMNPHLIYPGDVLTLQWHDGRPMLAVNRPPKRKLNLSPNITKTTKAGAIPVLSSTSLAPYLSNDMIISEQEYQRLPHLLGNNSGDIRFITDDMVLARARGRSRVQYTIVRKLNTIHDRFGNEVGVQVRHVADGFMTQVQPENEWLIKVSQSNYEAKRGDRLYATNNKEIDDMRLTPGTERQRGEVVGNLHQRSLMGRHDVVIVDLGAEDILPGTVLGIYNRGPTIFDGEEPEYDQESHALRGAFDDGNTITQPAVKIGEVVVFKTFDKASYAMILRADELVKNGAILAAP